MTKFGHGGDIRALALEAGCAVEELLDFSANINPLGPPDSLRQVVSSQLGQVSHYPDPFCGDEVVIIGQPGNPSGATFDPRGLLAVADKHPSSTFVVDEAFAEFVEGYESVAALGRPNIEVLRSMTKFYAVPGIRLGYAVGPNDIIERLQRELPPWSVGSLAQAGGVAFLNERHYAKRTREEVPRLREPLKQGLEALDITVFPSAAARIDRDDLDAPALARSLIQEGVCQNYERLLS